MRRCNTHALTTRVSGRRAGSADGVAEQRDAGAERAGLEQREVREPGAVGDESAAATLDDRVDEQPELVHEAGGGTGRASSVMLPVTTRSPSPSAFSRRASSTASPDSTVECAQPGSPSVAETTYFCRRSSSAPAGSSVCCGQ